MEHKKMSSRLFAISGIILISMALVLLGYGGVIQWSPVLLLGLSGIGLIILACVNTRFLIMNTKHNNYSSALFSHYTADSYYALFGIQWLKGELYVNILWVEFKFCSMNDKSFSIDIEW